ncbi:hypothetical protein M8C21_028671 [Ambrosia artemisiifolia]|uniref:Uncharacterized protein n=1 Tax=Ambrosia artemisiifolia TaxID=4212 RepID=A0AAD5D9F1_AMBAR|nr:hypothetical protein M8C21_028671 [Ambrosia artemisiifolia]
MAAGVVARSFLRSSTSMRASASRISATIKPPPPPPRSPFSIRPQKPRLFRSPVEMSCVTVESFFPFHTATASALLNSMLSTTPCRSGWLIDGMFSHAKMYPFVYGMYETFLLAI